MDCSSAPRPADFGTAFKSASDQSIGVLIGIILLHDMFISHKRETFAQRTSGTLGSTFSLEVNCFDGVL